MMMLVCRETDSAANEKGREEKKIVLGVERRKDFVLDDFEKILIFLAPFLIRYIDFKPKVCKIFINFKPKACILLIFPINSSIRLE